MTAEYEQLVDDAEEGRATLLDTYGAENEAEFFAVATECFFDCPVELAPSIRSCTNCCAITIARTRRQTG